MSEFIINKNKIDREYPLASEQEGDIVYTISGRQDKIRNGFYVLEVPVQEAEENPYAHAIKNSSSNTYWVKVGENGRLFNPYGLYSEGMERKKRVGRSTWKFRSVNANIFNQYVRFLTSKNETFLHNAEREMI